MPLVSEHRKELFAISVYADFLRHATASLVSRPDQASCEYFRIVADTLCTAVVIMNSISSDAGTSAVGAAKRARYHKYGSAILAVD
jgi:hypothetical protein